MIRTTSDILEAALQKPTVTLAVACAQEYHVLEAVAEAKKIGLVHPILVGDEIRIREIAEQISFDLVDVNVIDEPDAMGASLATAKMVASGKADTILKGLVDTKILLKALLNREIGLRTGRLVSHVLVMQIPGYNKLFLATDAAVNIAPDLKAKVSIVKNAVQVAHALGIEEPKVAILCAVEKVNEAMPATVDAHALTEMYRNGEIEGCQVFGPLQFDNAVSEEAAMIKKIDNPVAGHADILVAPDIEAGNVLIKTAEYFAKSEKAGVILGVKAPIALTSRASSIQAKLNCIALACLLKA